MMARNVAFNAVLYIILVLSVRLLSLSSLVEICNFDCLLFIRCALDFFSYFTQLYTLLDRSPSLLISLQTVQTMQVIERLKVKESAKYFVNMHGMFRGIQKK